MRSLSLFRRLILCSLPLTIGQLLSIFSFIKVVIRRTLSLYSFLASKNLFQIPELVRLGEVTSSRCSIPLILLSLFVDNEENGYCS